VALRECGVWLTTRYDFQGISDDAELPAILACLPQFAWAR
jgi:hypothetical protein